MLPTVRELLADQFVRADPLVLAGHSRLGRTVRWVHSSEIFEISPLLSGGELLLTTGLGLAGVDAGTRRHYLREIAGRGVAGVAFELGRTFAAIPPDMVEEASRNGLPLIALRTVVPFIDLCRSANTEIVSREVRSLRILNDLARDLTAELVAGNGVARLLGRIGAVTECALIVMSASGALIAAHGVDDDRSAWVAVESAVAQARIGVRENVWGTLTAGPGSTLDAATLAAVLDQSAPSLGLSLTHSGAPRGSNPQQTAAALLADLVDGKQIRQADLKARAAAAGAPALSGRTVVPVAIDAPDTRIATRFLDGAAKELGKPGVIAEVHATAYAVLAVEATVTDPVGQVGRALRKSFATNGTEGVSIVVGDPCEFTAAALTAALSATRSALRLATRHRRDWLGGPLVTCRELATELIVESLPAAERARLAATTIAPLIAWDGAHHSNLTRTLEVYLRHGASPTRCAAAMHIGRQSLYQRLDRIRDLLGYDPNDPALAATLLLALCAHRLGGDR